MKITIRALKALIKEVIDDRPTRPVAGMDDAEGYDPEYDSVSTARRMTRDQEDDLTRFTKNLRDEEEVLEDDTY